MSWARLGAQATGVDISDAAIGLARTLNDELQFEYSVYPFQYLRLAQCVG